MVFGKGSNCLFDDMGFDGCVILNRIEFLERIEPGMYRVGSGFGFNRLSLQCANEGFTGLEFAGGIPGTVGGAVYMNAGENGQKEIISAGWGEKRWFSVLQSIQNRGNFIINCDGSTSEDMLQLIDLVKETVYQKFGVELEEEILYVFSMW